MKEISEELARTLLERIGKGDQSALQALHGHMARRIYAFALNRLHDEQEAETVVIDTLMEVWKQPARFNFQSKLSTWILGIARNKILTMLRGRTPISEELDEEMPSETLGPFELWQRGREGAELRGCMDRLSDDHRESIQLVYLQELSIGEVAALIGHREGTIKSRLHHARQYLKACLEAQLRRGGA